MIWEERTQLNFWAGRRPFREARLRSYISTQHRHGRTLLEILDDPYVQRIGGDRLCRRVLEDASMIALLEDDVAQAIRDASRAAGSAPR